MKRERQQAILELISDGQRATQQELAAELEARGIEATQSSVSRDIAELGLVKINGHYAAPRPGDLGAERLEGIDTAGTNLIVVKTEIGQAQPAALVIDGAGIPEIVGTVAGDDTILVAVKNEAAQRVAMRKMLELFARQSGFTKRRQAESRPEERKGRLESGAGQDR
jgi:transcriptional regulator of arginine metabolism